MFVDLHTLTSSKSTINLAGMWRSNPIYRRYFPITNGRPVNNRLRLSSVPAGPPRIQVGKAWSKKHVLTETNFCFISKWSSLQSPGAATEKALLPTAGLTRGTCSWSIPLERSENVKSQQTRDVEPMLIRRLRRWPNILSQHWINVSC